MRFTKMHGIGNDYVYVNGFDEKVADPTSLAPVIADRHTGVGGDGLILVLPPEQGVDAHVRMRMFNADGSESEMCGNGVRCVAKYAHDHGLTDAKPMRVQTGNGVLTIDFTTNGNGRLAMATVDMGEPIIEAAKIPVKIPGVGDVDRVIGHPFEGGIDLPDPAMTCVSMGNPHVTFFVDDVQAIPLATIGPVIENHPWFPRRINVHFVQVHSRGEVTMRTWERGSGITLACGTGASAVCVAGVLTGKTDRRILAHLPGGDLTLEWRESDKRVYMTGPATEVFSGEWPD
ncbi:MAG: diaminopimelate epimerase [Phycisphaera sp.]|nr:diaminopimelate epimerase [Phycisphaera sp.]